MERPSYYAILTAQVRYDKRLCPMARLMYAEITALTNKDGYCRAGNRYFAKKELYDVSEETVSRWISQLKKFEHIFVVMSSNDDGTERRIYIDEKQAIAGGLDKKINTGLDKKRKTLLYNRNIKEFKKNRSGHTFEETDQSPPLIASDSLGGGAAAIDGELSYQFLFDAFDVETSRTTRDLIMRHCHPDDYGKIRLCIAAMIPAWDAGTERRPKIRWFLVNEYWNENEPKGGWSPAAAESQDKTVYRDADADHEQMMRERKERLSRMA